MKNAITKTIKIPAESQRTAPAKLADQDLAFRYVSLLKAGSDDGNETAFLEDEMRRRWLLEHGFDLKNL